DAPEEAQDADTTDDVLNDLADTDLPEEVAGAEDSSVADVLDGLESPETEDTDDTDLDALLSDLSEGEEPDEETDAGSEDLDALLADLGEDDPTDTQEDDTDLDALLSDLSEGTEPEEETDAGSDDLDALLADLGGDDPADDDPTDIEADDTDLDALLADLADDEPEAEGEPDAENDDLDDLLADLDASDVGGETPDEEDSDALDDLLADLDASDLGTDEADDLQDDADTQMAEAPDDSDLDALLSELSDMGDAVAEAPEAEDDTDLDALLADLEGDDGGGELDDLLADLDAEDDEDDSDGLDDLDALLADLDDGDETEEPAAPDDSDLDALLSDLESDEPADLDALLSDDDAEGGDDDLDALLAGLDDDTESAETETQADAETEMSEDPELAFGTISAARPEPQKLERKRFRIAIFGDFSGRSARGLVETGDGLANRKATLLDPDTVEEIIEGFATKLVLPIGKEGAGIEVELKELDDLHPDELYEKVDLFEGLASLKSQLSAGATAENAAKQLIGWGEEFGQAVVPPRRTSSGNTVRADLKLSDFQKLIGDTGGELAQASPLDDLLKRIVGPHIRKLPDADTTAMQKAVDEALSSAMRMVLHHPEFQSIEAQWRSLDLIARSVETDDTLEIMLYDVSAEEIAADLAAEEDLAKTGLVRLLTEEPLDEENGRGGYSALIGMYTFEETPPHAEILGRIGRVAAHVDAPFFSAITPSYLDVEKKDRHPLVAEAWDTLRGMPEAGHLGLASPRFLLRRPYGAKSEPIYEFDFEEFTMAEGLRGMLWANPVVLVTILLAQSFRKNGRSMGLGSVMSLGGMPFHYVNDRYGDQVALPCTERNLTMAQHEQSVQRGYMPILSPKGRDEIRLGTFNGLAGSEILGPWTGVPAPEPSPPQPEPPAADEDEDDGDDLDLDMDFGGDDDDDSGDDDLDALLAGFGDDSDDEDDDGDDDEMDAELAALLADL
ncbi:MAG: type VI secretion system contractile sheath large subunit, partial [Paracoccaceae bacterium]